MRQRCGHFPHRRQTLIALELGFHSVRRGYVMDQQDLAATGRQGVLGDRNAGIAQQKLFTDITPEEWQRMLDVNLTGAFNLCQLALPGMIRRKAGRILTVSSMWGQTGGSCEVHYSAAKAGLIGLTKALAKEEGPSGITVNCVAPGVIDTDMMAAFTAEDKAALAEETPVGRLGSADEVAQLLVFLAGEGAGYITGQVFGVNGGLVI
jgi:3-oxoacyl-[acyl-carrier protein] reductase